MNRENNKFRISGWYIPQADKDIFAQIKKCGLNHVFLQGANVENDCRNVSIIDEYLTLCDDYGLEAYVQRGVNTEISLAVENATTFAKHENFTGFLVYDEPTAGQFNMLRNDLMAFSAFEDVDYFVNLLPSYARGDHILDNYAMYVQRFAQEVLSQITSGEKWLSFDFYPLMYGKDETYDLAERWLYDTQIIAKEKKKNGCKSNAFVQTMPFSYGGKSYGSRERIPSYVDLSLQVYTYLAFGFDGISYFCLGTPEVDGEFRDSHFAMFDRDGNTTEIYDSVATLNKEILALTEEYLKYSWDTTYILGDDKDDCYAFLQERPSFVPTKNIKDVQVDGNVLVGMFGKIDGEGMVLVNFGEPTCQKRKTVQVRLESEKNVAIWKNGQREKVSIKDMAIELNPGEGVFIEIL